MVRPGDQIKWSLEQCIFNDASQKITWEMATKGYCVVLDLAPVPPETGVFGSFEEEQALVYQFQEEDVIL